ncbi:MAG: methylmalonyl-CoA mutase family protein, partial [Pseudomonadota bacterium]|nr:methylmalonyl-CoA mutase family protein [Pseudomonadota bacterium]
MSQAAVTSERPLAPLPEPDYRIRFITAASLFDGHDASINVMRRILQSSGVEVIHLGHNRSVQEIVDAAVEEDAQGIAVSSYQGGHTEFFKYMIDMLTQRGRADIRVFGGGGGVIVPAEIQELQDYGVCRIYSPQDGHALGLQGMIDDMIERADFYPARQTIQDVGQLDGISVEDLARVITALENETASVSFVDELRTAASENKIAVPVLGITGTGGSGKSSLTDELILRLRFEFGDSLRIAILAIDPSRRKTGGALLGDRIRMNAIEGASVFMRSLATRTSGLELPSQLPEIIEATKRAGFGLVIVETPGIGQGDSGIVPLVDCSLYVMTPEFGAATQLEKIDMLDYADFIAINKFDRKGAEDALRDVRKQTQRNRQAFEQSLDQMPVYGTMASSFNDQGVTSLYNELFTVLEPLGLPARRPDREPVVSTGSNQRGIVPASRQRYLSEIAEAVRSYRDTAARQAQIARECQQLQAAIRMLGEQGKNTDELQQLAAEREKALSEGSQLQLQAFPKLIEEYSGSSLVYSVQGRDITQPLTHTSLSGTKVPRVSLPRYQDHGDILRWLMFENIPGRFPFTAGVFPFKRENEDPTRMFSGEGDAFRTNRRFHYLSRDTVAKRLSTAFDSVTLYGADPAQRPDIYGKVGTSGVSIATLDDMRALYDGF